MIRYAFADNVISHTEQGDTVGSVEARKTSCSLEEDLDMAIDAWNSTGCQDAALSGDRRWG